MCHEIYTLKAEIRREYVIYKLKLYYADDYNIQHNLLDSGSVCCISANLSIDSVLDIPSSSPPSGPVRADVKQQQKTCQRMNDICLKIVRLFV